MISTEIRHRPFPSVLTLLDAFGFGKREMISLIGAGGKTTLMFNLAREMREKGLRVVTTTTTKILEPSLEEGGPLFVSDEKGELLRFVEKNLERCGHLTLARERLAGGKLKGIEPECADDLWEREDIDFLLIEADGAAGRPVKAPRSWEPVIPSKTTTVIGLLGLDGIGRELNEEEVFQPVLVSKITGIPLGEKVTEDGMALLLVHPEGVFKGAPDSARRIAFLNKTDFPDGWAKGRRVAQRIVERGCPPIERVVLGSLQDGRLDVIFP